MMSATRRTRTIGVDGWWVFEAIVVSVCIQKPCHSLKYETICRIGTHRYERETMDLNDTAAFVAVAHAASFTRAAERLGLPKGTVSRQVARLERNLGARLLQRTTRTVALTDVGRAYFERCRNTVEAIADANRLVAHVKGTVTGTL